VSVETDPLPQILAGIPLPYRDVRIDIDRPRFMRNPTSCEPATVNGLITSTEGRSASPSPRFQLGSCPALGFKPRISMRLVGPTHRSAHPKLRMVVSGREEDANIGAVALTLPATELLEMRHIGRICSEVQYAADRCPAGSVYGHAFVRSPLLDHPLEGAVYLRAGERRLPDLVAYLGGEVHIDLAGRVESVHGRLRTTFAEIPDAPLAKFVLTMRGGSRGLLVNTGGLCSGRPLASIRLGAHNGKARQLKVRVKSDCGKALVADKTLR
jgi:hypothetical protein